MAIKTWSENNPPKNLCCPPPPPSNVSALSITYTPSNPSAWTSPIPSNVQQALDSLANRPAGGELSGTYPNPILVNNAVTGKVLTGLSIVNSAVIATDSILQAIGKLQGQINASSSLTLNNGQIFVGNSSNVAQQRTPSGELLMSNTGVFTLDNNAVTEKLLSTFVLLSGTISPTDTIVEAFGKLQTAVNNSISNSLLNGQILIGNTSNIATAVTPSGEATIDNLGVISLSNPAVLSKILTGLSLINSQITATDDILTAFGKLQGQLNNNVGYVLSDGAIWVGDSTNLPVERILSGEATINNVGSITLSNSAIISKVLTGFALQSGTISATDTILQAFGKIQNAVNNSLSTTLASGQIIVGNASNIATAVIASGEATIDNAGVITLNNNAVINKILNGFVLVSGTISATDTILQAFGKAQNQLNNIIANYLTNSLNNGQILIGNASNVATPVLPYGEATIANDGNIILDNNSVLAKTIPPIFTPVIASIAANDSIKTAFEKTQGQLDNTVNEWVSPPPTSTTTGTQGQKAFDSNYVYFCVLNNTWVRVPRDLTIW